MPGETHLPPLVQLVSDMIEPRARAKGLEFHREFQQGLPECVVTENGPGPWPPEFGRLQEAARIGDVREVLREGERLKARFPEHQAALGRVLQLASDFEILALQRLLG